MKTSILLILLSFIAQSAQACPTSGELRCACDSNRTQLHGTFLTLNNPQWLSFSIDDHIVEMNERDQFGQMTALALVNLEYKVFTLSAKKVWPGEGDYVSIELIADPASMRIADAQTALRMQFRAEVVGTEPRPNQESSLSKNIKVNCTFAYEKP